jgi:hypothetical protein
VLVNLEDQLRDALRREPAPAAMLVVAATPALIIEQRRERGIQARDRLLTALKVTNATLRHTREMIHKNVRRSS